MSIRLQLYTITTPGCVDVVDLGPAHPATVRTRDVLDWMAVELDARPHLYDDDGAPCVERLAEAAA